MICYIEVPFKAGLTVTNCSTINIVEEMTNCLDPVSEIEIEVFQELIDLNHSFIVSLCRLHHEHTIVTYSALAVLEMKI